MRLLPRFYKHRLITVGTLFQRRFPAPFPIRERNGGLTSNCPFLVTQWANRNLEVRSSRNDLAMKWHNDHNQYTQTDHYKPQLQHSRVNAYARICTDTDLLARKFMDNEAFQKAFNPIRGKYHIRKELRVENGPLQPLFASADALLEMLGGIGGDVKSRIQTPVMAIAIDEASCFFDTTALTHSGMARERDSDAVVPDRYIALNRVMSCLRHKAIWMIFASTQSQIKNLLPPAYIVSHQGGSGHSFRAFDAGVDLTSGLGGETKQLRCLKPFSLFPFDVRRQLQEPKDTKARRKEFYMPVQDYLQVAQIKRFGRPLWAAFDDIDALKTAAVKLLGGPGHDYNPSNKNHVFAVMAARVSLDVAIANPRAYSFSTDAVDGHLRVVTRIHIDPPTFETWSPSEPIVARAASELLCEKEKSNIWSLSLRTLHRELLFPGLLDPGPWGELAARYLMILAHDQLRFSSIDRIDQDNMFTVNHLLRSLLNSTHHHVLDHLDQDISESWMNFSHFVSTLSSVKEDEQAWIGCELLRRNAALQYGRYQRDYDQYFPSYAGDIASAIDPKKINHIFVQVKNQKGKSNPGRELGVHVVEASESIRQSSSRAAKEADISTSSTAPRNQKLVIWMDLGIQPAEYTVTLYRPRDDAQDSTWILQCIGASSQVYGCLESMNCQEAWKECFEIDSEHKVDPIEWADTDKLHVPLESPGETAKQTKQMHQYYQAEGVLHDGESENGGAEWRDPVNDTAQSTEMDWSQTNLPVFAL